MTENTSNINPTFETEELLRALIALSKQEAPELDDYFHFLNAQTEINNILGIELKDDDIVYVNKLKEISDKEKTLLYETIRVEGEPVDGIPQVINNQEEEPEKIENEVIE